MTQDKIEITYVEFDNEPPNVAKVPIGGLYYTEWRRNGGEIESAHANPREEGDPFIPNDVRIAIAMLVAPGLVEAKK